MELEGPAAAIDRAAQELGFSKRDYILKNYLVLYMEDCRRKGEEPRHMVFLERKLRSKPSSNKNNQKNRRKDHSFLDNERRAFYH